MQFRESLQIARALYQDDLKLKQLEQEECNTDNLSPWPGIALEREKLDHDEFMRRILGLARIDQSRQARLERIGRSYLDEIRQIQPQARAASIASYEDGGLERVFRAILTAQDWSSPSLLAFQHFLVEHVRFDSDPEQGHGALSRHISVDDRILPVWEQFRCLLVAAAPSLDT